MWSDLTLSPYFKVKREQQNLKVLITPINSLIIDSRGFQCKINLWNIMGWESDVVRFHLWPLLQGQMMVYRIWLIVFPVDTNLHQFSNV